MTNEHNPHLRKGSAPEKAMQLLLKSCSYDPVPALSRFKTKILAEVEGSDSRIMILEVDPTQIDGDDPHFDLTIFYTEDDEVEAVIQQFDGITDFIYNKTRSSE